MADRVTSGVSGSIGYSYNANKQFAFASTPPVLSPLGSGNTSTGTILAQDALFGLYRPSYGQRATLRTFVEGTLWTKDGTQVKQRQSSYGQKRTSSVLAHLRNTRVWIDSPELHSIYTLHDEDGSFKVDTSGRFDVSLTATSLQGATNAGLCSTFGLGSSSSSRRHLSHCSLSLAATDFDNLLEDESMAVAMTVTPGGNSAPINKALGEVVLTKPPSWFDPSLRSRDDGQRTAVPGFVTTSTFLTLPTHPVYATGTAADDEFEAILFANDDLYAVHGFTIELQYDESKLIYVGHEQSGDFAQVTESTGSTSAASGHTVKTFMTTEPSADGLEKEEDRKGCFYMLSFTFKFVSGTSAGTYDDLIAAKLVTFVNMANNVIPRSNELAHVLDRRDNFPWGATAAQMVVRDTQVVALLPYAPDFAGEVLDTYALTGVHAGNSYSGTVVTDFQTSTARGKAYYAANQVSCSEATQGMLELSSSQPSSACYVTPAVGVASSDVASFTLSYESLTSLPIAMRIAVPTNVRVVADYTTLNKIAGDLTCDSNSHAFQKTRVRVFANGLDVTSLATNLVSSNPSLADVAFTGTGAALHGKSVGTVTVSLYDGSDVQSDTITISPAPVMATELRNRVITDISWRDAPPSTFTYPGQFGGSILLQQIFTQRPSGDEKAHHGYLFSTVVWSDGETETIFGDETSTNSSTPNIVWTEPGGIDMTPPNLAITNEAENRWMVAVAPDAHNECIEDTDTSTSTATFRRCGTDIITSGVPMFINVPKAQAVYLDIVQGALSPIRDAASVAPFNVPTSSTFRVTVTYNDGSQVDSFAAESGVTYSTDDPSCATVDNDLNIVTIVAGATCNTVGVTVVVSTASGQLHQASAVATVTRLSSVTTHMDAYPAGSEDISTLHLLPCTTNTFERGQLRTIGILETGEQEVVTEYMTYSTTDMDIAQTIDNIVVPGSSGSVVVGGSSEISLPNVDVSNVAWTPKTIVIASSQRSPSLVGVWDLADGTTLNLVQSNTVSTQFDLSYSGGDGVSFEYSALTGYSWINTSEIISFTSSQPALVSVNSNGTLSQLGNHYEQVEVVAHSECTSNTWTRFVWSNLKVGTQDVDMGTQLDNSLAPYYVPAVPADGQQVPLHVWVRPLWQQYLRAVQIKVTLPAGLTSVGGSFEPDGSNGFMTVASFNVEGSQIMGLTSTHPSAVPKPGKIYLGHFNVMVTPGSTGLLPGSLTVEVVTIQSDTEAIDGSQTNIRSTKQFFQAVAAEAPIFLGMPVGRRLHGGKMAAHSVHTVPSVGSTRTSRRLSPCNPCTAMIFGDVNGDCQFNVQDVSAAQTFATAYSAFATGSSKTNPLLLRSDHGCGNDCTWCNDQLNPTHNLLDGTFGGNDDNDDRFGKPDINLQDVIHLSRATQYMNRFVMPSAECVASSTVLLRADTYGGPEQDHKRVQSTVQNDAIGTDVYFEVVIADNASVDQQFTLTQGTHITQYANPFDLYGAGPNVPVTPNGTYSRASGTQAGILIKADYDDNIGSYVAQLKPLNYVGDVEYWVAVGVETKMNSRVDVLQTQAFLGLSTFPYAAGGFSFNPILGSPYSAVMRNSLVCDTDECEGITCHNDGTCIDQVGGYTCDCVDGFAGTHCDRNIDECIGVTCQNGGTCVDQIGGYDCSCMSGYEGTSCETDVDGCAGQTCSGQGTCSDVAAPGTGYTCTCSSGYEGTDCQTDVNGCAGQYCSGQGTCSDVAAPGTGYT
jgi:hypothetical protein